MTAEPTGSERSPRQDGRAAARRPRRTCAAGQREGGSRWAAFQEERDQYRLLFRAFLRRLFENDLFPDTVDPRLLAVWLAAALASPPAFFALRLWTLYGPGMTDAELALASVPHKLFFIGYSMAVSGLLTVLVWDALFPDRRDAVVLGGLPVRTRTAAAARLAALAAFVVGFVVVVNTPASVLYPLVAGGQLPVGAVVRYPLAHFAATVSAGVLVFLVLVAAQAVLALALPPRFVRRASTLAQLLFVVLLIEWLFFAPGLLLGLAAVDPGVTPEALAAADDPYRFLGLPGSPAAVRLPPAWFLGLYEVVWGFAPDSFRRLHGMGVAALAATFAAAALAYCAAFPRILRQARETPPDAAPRAGFVSRAAARVAGATVLRHPVERAVVGFAARSLARSRRHRLVLAAWAGAGLAVALGLLPGPLAGIADEDPVGWLSTPSMRLLSVPFVLALLMLVALRFLFAVPTEMGANRVFRMTEADDKAAYLGGARKAMWLLGAMPIALVTLPVYAVSWGAFPALGHTLFWLLVSGCLAEVLLCRFHKVPFTCSYVPGRARVMYLWPLYGLFVWGYAYQASRLDLWLLGDPVRWGVGCAAVASCLALAIAYRRRRLAFAAPLLYDDEVEPAVRVMSLMKS